MSTPSFKLKYKGGLYSITLNGEKLIEFEPQLYGKPVDHSLVSAICDALNDKLTYKGVKGYCANHNTFFDPEWGCPSCPAPVRPDVSTRFGG